MKKIFLTLFFALTALLSAADTIDDARALVVEGDYWKAKKLLLEIENSNPKMSQTPQFQYLLGVCEFEDGKYEEARKLLEYAAKKRYGPASLYLGRLAFLDYDFDKAEDYYADFDKFQQKTGHVGAETLKIFERQLSSAKNAIGRVENIVIIDSLALPKDTFFKAYKLPTSAGKLLYPFEIPFEDHQGGAVMAFLNESGDDMLWGEPDSVGNVKIVESIRLVDGEWQEPVPVPDILGGKGYSEYPFMMPDGVTLYYASTGEDSMGGYDIFVASRDPSTGQYLQPQNIGMPFNSPYDDYMLAIDEENGVGWWATDRNNLGDKVTVYVYVTNEVRNNYNPDDENILDKAKITSYKSTWNSEDASRYSEILQLLSNIDPDREVRKPDFHFPVWGATYYTSLDDFKSVKAREAMKKYLEAEKDIQATEKKLKALRERYPVNHADNVRQDILRLEKELEQQKTNLISIRSDIYRFEKEKR